MIYIIQICTNTVDFHPDPNHPRFYKNHSACQDKVNELNRSSNKTLFSKRVWRVAAYVPANDVSAQSRIANYVG